MKKMNLLESVFEILGSSFYGFAPLHRVWTVVLTRIYQDPVYLERGFSYFRRFVQTIQVDRENQGAVIEGI